MNKIRKGIIAFCTIALLLLGDIRVQKWLGFPLTVRLIFCTLSYTVFCALFVSLLVFAVRSTWKNRRLESALLLLFSLALNVLLLPACLKVTVEIAQLAWCELTDKKDLEKVSIELRTKQHMQELIAQSNQKPLVIKISSIGCPPCTLLRPVYKQISHEMRDSVTFAEIELALFDEFQSLGITGIPTLVYYKNGQEIKRTVGFASAEQLRKELQDIISL